VRFSPLFRVHRSLPDPYLAGGIQPQIKTFRGLRFAARIFAAQRGVFDLTDWGDLCASAEALNRDERVRFSR
jgi:hypothetical protein